MFVFFAHLCILTNRLSFSTLFIIYVIFAPAVGGPFQPCFLMSHRDFGDALVFRQCVVGQSINRLPCFWCTWHYKSMKGSLHRLLQRLETLAFKAEWFLWTETATVHLHRSDSGQPHPGSKCINHAWHLSWTAWLSGDRVTLLLLSSGTRQLYNLCTSPSLLWRKSLSVYPVSTPSREVRRVLIS